MFKVSPKECEQNILTHNDGLRLQYIVKFDICYVQNVLVTENSALRW